MCYTNNSTQLGVSKNKHKPFDLDKNMPNSSFLCATNDKGFFYGGYYA